MWSRGGGFRIERFNRRIKAYTGVKQPSVFYTTDRSSQCFKKKTKINFLPVRNIYNYKLDLKPRKSNSFFLASRSWGGFRQFSHRNNIIVIIKYAGTRMTAFLITFLRHIPIWLSGLNDSSTFLFSVLIAPRCRSVTKLCDILIIIIFYVRFFLFFFFSAVICQGPDRGLFFLQIINIYNRFNEFSRFSFGIRSLGQI